MYNPLQGSASRRQVIESQDVPVRQSRLSWSPLKSDIIISGDTEINILKNIRNTVLSIRREFQTNTDPKIHINPLNRDDFNKRLILVEGEVQGLMKKKINLTPGEGQRSLDYSALLNEKENQVIEMQKKIQNLEFQLRKHSARELQLQNHIVYLNDDIRVKEEIINGKNEIILAEVATSNALRDALNLIRRNVDMNKYKIQDLDRIVLADVVIPEFGSFQIRAETLVRNAAQIRSRTFQQLPQSQQFKTRIIELFREVQRIMNSQNGQINELQFERVLQGFIMSQKQSRLFEKSMIAAKRNNIEERYQRLRENFAIAGGIYHDNLQKLKRDNPNVRINFEKNLFEILQMENVKAYQVQNGAVFIDAYTEKVVQVPVQDARTKHLIHLFGHTLKKFTTKYPQLLKEMDPKLCEFFQQEVIDLIQVDEVEKLVNIVKYVPQVVKVENVYAYSSEKSRKVEFHLRVLIKALLQELHKIKNKTGVVLEMDEGVLGMISSEIMGVVNVDDILKVFRPVPKIVEVEKIVEKIVEKRIQIPMVIPIVKEIQKIVQVERIVEIQKIVNVPLQIPVIQTQIVEKIVPVQQIIYQVIEVPTIVERIVYVNQEVTKIVEVPTIVEKIVEVERVVEVQRIVNHVQHVTQEIQIIKEKIVPVQRIVEKIVEVPVIKEKIVQRIVQVPKVEIIERIVEKVVPMIEYRKALEVNNHIETIHKPVDRIVDRIVPVIKIVQRIVQVPQIVEKIVEVIVQRVEIREVIVIREKLIKEEVIKPVQVIVKEYIEVIREVPVEVEKIIEIPVVQEVIRIVQEIIQKPIIQRVQNTVIKVVYLRDPMIVYQPKLVQVQKIVNHYIQVPKPVRYVQEKIIEIPRNVQRIKEVRVEIEKIVEKMVEVPKIVEVQKIVQKIVVVPRVIEKVIEVPQIVEKLVEKIVEKIVVKEVERQVQVPVIQERIVEVEVIKNVYIEVEKAVQRVVDKLVTITNTEEKIVTQQLRVENTIEVISQVPKTLYVDKIVPAYYEQIKPIQVQKVVIVPREIAVPVEVVVEKVIPIREIVEKVIQVPQFIQKIVQTKQDNVRVEYIEKIVEKIVVDERIKEVEKMVPYIQEVIKEVPTIVEKIVTVETKVQQIITAQQIIEKIVERTTTVPRIYEVQKIVPKLIKVPEIIEIERIIPQVIRVNEYIQRIVEKVVEVPRIIEKIRQIEIEKEKLVSVTNVNTQIVEVERIVQKIAILQQMKEVIKNVNHIQRVIKIVEQIERIPVEVAVREEILIEIPYILEKIVEKIVVMPQIVEVLKYVHEIAESDELLTVQNQQEFQAHEVRLVHLMRNIKPATDELLKELRNLKNIGQVAGRIPVLENFLSQFDKLIAFPKLVRIKGKDQLPRMIQTEQKIVRVPIQSQQDLRKEISMSILVEKLIMQIKRLITRGNLPLQLDDQIKMIFFPELQAPNKYSMEGELKDKFNLFAQQVSRKFETFGPWAEQSQLMLNTILQERFKLAQIIETANMEIQRSKLEYDNVLNLLDQQTRANKSCQEHLNRLKSIIRSYPREKQQQLTEILTFIEDTQARQGQSESMLRSETTRLFGREVVESQIVTESFESKLREKEATIEKLKETILSLQKTATGDTKLRYNQDYVRTLQSEIEQLRQGRSMYDSRFDVSQLQESYKRDIAVDQQRIQLLQSKNSELRTSLENATRELKVLHQNEKFLMRRDQQPKVEQSSLQASGTRFQSLFGHSEIKRTDQSFLSQSQYSLYQPRPQEFREDLKQSQLRKPTQIKEEEPKMRTPLEMYKYRSPYSTDIKQTQSFLREESMTGQSPQGHTVFTTPASIKREHEQQFESRQKQIGQTSEAKGYTYFYSPQGRGRLEKRVQPKQ